jgi:hypothetical protein
MDALRQEWLVTTKADHKVEEGLSVVATLTVSPETASGVEPFQCAGSAHLDTNLTDL